MLWEVGDDEVDPKFSFYFDPLEIRVEQDVPAKSLVLYPFTTPDRILTERQFVKHAKRVSGNDTEPEDVTVQVVKGSKFFLKPPLTLVESTVDLKSAGEVLLVPFWWVHRSTCPKKDANMVQVSKKIELEVWDMEAQCPVYTNPKAIKKNTVLKIAKAEEGPKRFLADRVREQDGGEPNVVASKAKAKKGAKRAKQA
jgi:hypothetical protein